MDPTIYYMGICNDGTRIEREDFDGDVLNIFPIRNPSKNFLINKDNTNIKEKENIIINRKRG